jgi:hypothetical protein
MGLQGRRGRGASYGMSIRSSILTIRDVIPGLIETASPTSDEKVLNNLIPQEARGGLASQLSPINRNQRLRGSSGRQLAEAVGFQRKLSYWAECKQFFTE